MGFGIVVLPDEETIEMCVASQKYSGRPPFRHSLAVTLYGDALRDNRPPDPAVNQLLEAMLSGLESQAAKPKPPKQRRKNKTSR
jgi:hypothetical protein